jgi:hypothetical protein
MQTTVANERQHHHKKCPPNFLKFVVLPRCCLSPSRQGKLCLVLDLDHTLLNSATFGEVGPVLHQTLELRATTEAETLPQHERLLFRMDGIKVSQLGSSWQCVQHAHRQHLHAAAELIGGWDAAWVESLPGVLLSHTNHICLRHA